VRPVPKNVKGLKLLRGIFVLMHAGLARRNVEELLLSFIEDGSGKGAKTTGNKLKYFHSKLKKKRESNINKYSVQKKKSL
jgi:hypothetical protein